MYHRRVRPLAGARVVSNVPGRLRLKLDPQNCSHDVMTAVRDRLKAQEGIDDVTVNRYSGSVTLRYDRSVHKTDDLLRTMQDLDIVVGQLAGGSPEEKTETGAPLTLGGALQDLDEQLKAVTGIHINLKAALPVMLAGMGVVSILRNGFSLNRIPGVFFLWMALDTFVKLHPPELQGQKRGGPGGERLQ